MTTRLHDSIGEKTWDDSIGDELGWQMWIELWEKICERLSDELRKHVNGQTMHLISLIDSDSGKTISPLWTQFMETEDSLYKEIYYKAICQCHTSVFDDIQDKIHDKLLNTLLDFKIQVEDDMEDHLRGLL